MQLAVFKPQALDFLRQLRIDCRTAGEGGPRDRRRALSLYIATQYSKKVRKKIMAKRKYRMKRRAFNLIHIQ
jgi:hypothetical protein